jgi:hypothetical protein
MISTNRKRNRPGQQARIYSLVLRRGKYFAVKDTISCNGYLVAVTKNCKSACTYAHMHTDIEFRVVNFGCI